MRATVHNSAGDCHYGKNFENEKVYATLLTRMKASDTAVFENGR